MPVSADLRGAVAALRNDPEAARGMARPVRATAGKAIGRNEPEVRGKRYSKHGNAESCGLGGAGFVAPQGITGPRFMSPSRRAGQDNVIRQRESGFVGSGLSEVRSTGPSAPLRTAKRVGKTEGSLTGAAATSLKTERMSSRSPGRAFSRNNTGSSVREAMLQTEAPAPELLGSVRNGREGKLIRPMRSSSPASSTGFGTIPVARSGSVGRGRGRDATPVGRFCPISHAALVRSASLTSTGSGKRVHFTPKKTGGKRDVSASPARSMHTPSDNLQRTIGMVGDRALPIEPAWKQHNQKRYNPTKPHPPKMLIHPSKPSYEEKPRGRSKTYMNKDEPRSVRGVSRSNTPNHREFDIVAPRMCPPSPLHDGE